MAEGARLESVYTGNRIEGSNPSPSANFRTCCVDFIKLKLTQWASVPQLDQRMDPELCPLYPRKADIHYSLNVGKDNYTLSVWHEVKTILRNLKT